MNPVLVAQDVWKAYKKKYALQGASLELNRGEILGLLGPNGAGKTTLIKIMATLLTKDSGTVEILGYDLDKHPNEIRHVLGYVGQDTERSAYARLTARENLQFFGSLRGLDRKTINEKIDELVEKFRFEEEILNKQFMHLSGGQKQAVVIMRALLHDPPILFLDEPTKGLDPFAAANIRRFLREYVKGKGKSLLLTSHILPEVDELADRCTLISKGKTPVTGTPTELKAAVGATNFIDIQATYLSESLVDEVLALPSVISYTTYNNGELWHRFGLKDLFSGTQDLLAFMRQYGIEGGFKHHEVSLEDAFIHFIGEFKDEVEA
ncbi:MAG: ABC transporter ATP-binding protein [Methanobacteriota archaeon]|nr:MAG: ABC transporter ATP-binding protein [Euryarchaeota archaeon]